MTKQSKAHQTWRRGELMAELFLQELEPNFVARSTISDFVFDFLIGFPNAQGGINTFAVEVKATEKPIAGKYVVRSKVYDVLAHSNVPVLLLVVDVKNNVFYYAWPSDHPEVSRLRDSVRVPVIRVDDATKHDLIARMAG
jgi:Domain of unknown function (DUF4365)